MQGGFRGNLTDSHTRRELWHQRAMDAYIFVP